MIRLIDFYLYDDTEDANVRFTSFVGDESRYDLALLQTNRHFGKTIVMNMQNNKFSIMGRDDLNEPGYIEYSLGVSENEAKEVYEFLSEYIH